MEKLIITVALTGSVPTREMSRHIPLTPQEIVADAVCCRASGASIAHVHARDDTGAPSLSADIFARIHQLVSEQTDMILQISTGGRAGMAAEPRAAAVRRLAPEMASLTTGSVNFPDCVYANSAELIDHLARAMAEGRTKPEMEIFEVGMIDGALRLAEQGLAVPPLHFDFVMGLQGAQPATPRQLLFLSESIPRDATWTVAGIGRWQLPMATLALVMGGHVRVGLEDNIYYRKGQLATNEELVARVSRLAAEIGREVATPDEARRILGLPVR